MNKVFKKCQQYVDFDMLIQLYFEIYRSWLVNKLISFDYLKYKIEIMYISTFFNFLQLKLREAYQV